MKAVLLKENQQIAVEEVREPELLKNTDVIIKIVKSAICGSDIHIKEGMIPVNTGTIMGHEFMGVVESVGSDVARFKPGDRVSAPPAVWCGACPACKRGQAQYCETLNIWGGGELLGPDLTGAQCGYVRMPNADLCLTPVPDNVSDEDAVFVGDVFSTGYHAVCSGDIQTGDTVAIFGCGPIGLGAVASAWQFGPSQVLAVDMMENRLALAEKYGAIPINAGEGDAAERIREMTGGQGADVVVEAIGNPAAFGSVLKSVRRGGAVSIVGLFPTPIEFPIHEMSMYGIRLNMGLAGITYGPRLMPLLETGRVSMKELITHTFPLEEAVKAYEVFENSKDQCMKVILEP